MRVFCCVDVSAL